MAIHPRRKLHSNQASQLGCTCTRYSSFFSLAREHDVVYIPHSTSLLPCCGGAHNGVVATHIEVAQLGRCRSHLPDCNRHHRQKRVWVENARGHASRKICPRGVRVRAPTAGGWCACCPSALGPGGTEPDFQGEQSETHGRQDAKKQFGPLSSVTSFSDTLPTTMTAPLGCFQQQTPSGSTIPDLRGWKNEKHDRVCLSAICRRHHAAISHLF